MKFVIGSAALLAVLAGPVFAQAPATAPAGSTGLCKDGSYWSGKLKLGACRGHKGVQTWYGAAPTAVLAKPAAPMATAVKAPTKTMAAPKTMAPAATATAAPAAGGGAGQVWVNMKSKVYHCPSDRYYGKTKEGQYMTESAALAAGAHADHGKACH